MGRPKNKTKHGSKSGDRSEEALRAATRALLAGYERELKVGHDVYWYGEDRAKIIEQKWGKYYR